MAHPVPSLPVAVAAMLPVAVAAMLPVLFPGSDSSAQSCIIPSDHQLTPASSVYWLAPSPLVANCCHPLDHLLKHPLSSQHPSGLPVPSAFFPVGSRPLLRSRPSTGPPGTYRTSLLSSPTLGPPLLTAQCTTTTTSMSLSHPICSFAT
ncbi:hypothetical protein LIA77_11411 [Sarocladium implicatum]|nr:hypothetical protein LIA77_11411 [Sarocladium implicatum]